MKKRKTFDFEKLRNDLRKMEEGDIVVVENADERTKQNVRCNVVYKMNKHKKMFQTFSFRDKFVIEKVQ